MNTILTLLTIVVVVGMTGYSIYLVNKHQKQFSALQGMAISMAVAIMTSLMSGYLVGILSGDLFLAGGIGMIIGFIVGIISGQPFGILAILSGSTSGLMGGIAGSLLGIFLSIENPYLMLVILLFFYIISLAFVILFIRVETNDNFQLDTKTISPFVILSVGIVLASLFLFLYSSNIVKVDNNSASSQTETSGNASSAGSAAASNTASVGSNTSNSATTEIDVTKDKTPTVKMEVSSTGYSPNMIYVKKGVPVKLEIHNPLTNSCLTTLLIPEFNIHANLKLGTTPVTFTPTKTGEFSFSCGMNMYGGKIIVE